MSTTIRDTQNINISGIASVSDGTVTNPSITFLNDSNTGMYQPADNQIAITTNGVQAAITNENGETGLGGVPVSDYRLTVRNPDTKNGVNIQAGESLGNIALHVSDQDDSFTMMEIESDQGYTTFGKTYAQTLIDNGVVYGIDNQNNVAAASADINAQSGVYRIGGADVVGVAQTFTNKTITAASNNVAANSLKTTGSSITVSTAAAPSVGQVLTAVSGIAANWQTPIPNPTFGTIYTFQASLAESSTTSTTFQTKVTLTTGSLVSGTYRLGYAFEISNINNAVLSEAQVVFDGTVVGVGTFESDNDYHMWSGFAIDTLSGVTTSTIQYRVQTTGTCLIRRARLEFFRIN